MPGGKVARMPGGHWAWRQGDGGQDANCRGCHGAWRRGCQDVRMPEGEEVRWRGGKDDRRPGLVTVNEDMRFCPFQIETEREGK